MAYRFLAGLAHGEPYALMQHMGQPEWWSEGGAMVRLGVSVGDVATLAAVTLAGIRPALHRSVNYFGWDVKLLEEWCQHAEQTALAYLPRNP